MRNGFFVEAGAGNGFSGSDTFVLENDYGWRGVCVEPEASAFAELTGKTRRRCKCVSACLDETVGTVTFVSSGDTSGIVSADTDNTFRRRDAALQRASVARRIVTLQTELIGDVLDRCGTPPDIHYMSLDVEGAEERILRSFPFTRYRVLALTVERPTATIHALLQDVGMSLVRYRLYDGFYLHASLARDHSGQGPSPACFRTKGF